MTTVAALAQRMTIYDSAAIHLSSVGMDRLLTVCDGLIGMPRAQRAALGPMHEGRVDVIGGGAIVIEELAIALPQLPDEVQRIGVTVRKKSPALMLVIHLISPDGSLNQEYISNYATINVTDVINRIDGDPSNVIGLSLPQTRVLLERVGVSVAELWLANPA